MNEEKENTGFDLSSIDTVKGSNAGADCSILTPSKQPTGVIWHILGKDSDQFRKLVAEQRKARMAKIQRGGKVTEEDVIEDGIDLLAKCVTGWSGTPVIINKKVIPYSVDNTARILREYPDIREQADNFIGERSNFTEG